MFVKRIAIVTAIALLSACSGGGHSATPVVNNNVNSTYTGQTVMVHMTFTIPSATTSSTLRRPQFVSPNIMSAVASAYQQSAGAVTSVVSTIIDLSPSSPTCSTGSGGRTCTISLPAPVGTDWFELDTYNQPPANSPCGPPPSTTCTAPTATPLAELSVGTDGGPTNSGYSVSSGSSVSVNIGLQGLIAKFSELGTSGTQYPSGSTRGTDPTDIQTNPLFVVSALGGVSNPQGQIAPPTGANGILGLDYSGGTISGATCTRADLFANGIALGDTTGSTYADPGGSYTSGGLYTQLFLQPCGTSGFVASPNQGFYIAFPNDALAGTYSGLGATGGEGASATAPYFSYVKGTSYTFPGSPTNGFAMQMSALNYTSPPPSSQASPHPFPLDPQPQVTPSVPITGKSSVTVLSPLFAAAVGSTAYSDSSNPSGGSGHAVLNLNGPGSTGTVWAAQFLLPTGSSGYTKSLSSGCTQASPAAVAVQLGTGTALVPGSTGWGMSWPVSAGTLASGGTSGAGGGPTCEITVSDGFNSVNIWVFNSVASGGGTITIP